MTEQPMSDRYVFWIPPTDFSVASGADAHNCLLPQIPLPMLREHVSEGMPESGTIGESLYDYLRQFPDCPRNTAYAELLRDIYPHYIADIGAHAAMLHHKDVSAAYIERMINQLKILTLLDPGNPGLHQQIGIACFNLAMDLERLHESGRNLLAALRHFSQSLRSWPDQPANLSYLAQINFWLGDYPAAQSLWGKFLAASPPEGLGEEVRRRLELLNTGCVPDYPLLDDLEQFGEGVRLCGSGDFAGARELLEDLSQKEWFFKEFSFPEFHYLLGLCRSRTGDTTRATADFRRALDVDPTFQQARDELNRIYPGDN